MALGVVKSLVGFLLLLNLCMFVIVASIADWVLNNAPEHTYSTGHGKSLPVGYSPVYFPTGNEATGLMIIFALIVAAVGAASCLSGLLHLRVWTAGQSLNSNTGSSMIAWDFTLLAIGLACKEMIYMGGRNTKLVTLESFIIIFCGTKPFLLLYHSGFLGENYCSYQDTYLSTSTTRAQSQRESTTVVSSV